MLPLPGAMGPWCVEGHDKIVQLHKKETSQAGEAGGKKFPLSRMDGGRGRTIFSV